MENTTIIKFVKEHGGELFNKNFVGVYPVDKLTDIISNIERTDYPFCIFNTDPINKPGTHWCAANILNEDNPSFFLFDPFGKIGLQYFFINDDLKILENFVENIDELLKKLNNDTKTFDYYCWKINCEKYAQLDLKLKNKLSDTCVGFINLMMSYLRYYNRVNEKKEKIIYMYGLIDQIQLIQTSMCGVHCLYFGFNLFNPHVSFEMLNETGDLKTIKKLISSIYVDTDINDSDEYKKQNLNLIHLFKDTYNIKVNTNSVKI